jgi:hypothetical protein
MHPLAYRTISLTFILAQDSDSFWHSSSLSPSSSPCNLSPPRSVDARDLIERTKSVAHIQILDGGKFPKLVNRIGSGNYGHTSSYRFFMPERTVLLPLEEKLVFLNVRLALSRFDCDLLPVKIEGIKTLPCARNSPFYANYFMIFRNETNKQRIIPSTQGVVDLLITSKHSETAIRVAETVTGRWGRRTSNKGSFFFTIVEGIHFDMFT